MSDCPAYDTINRLTVTYIATTTDSAVASIAIAAKQGFSARSPQSTSHHIESNGERLAMARRVVCREPFDRAAFDSAIIGLEECAEKRYLMAVASYRAAHGRDVPSSAAQDIEAAMRQDPGNAEYLQFAEILLGNLGDQSLKSQIEGERKLIRKMAAQGVPERGRWV